VLGSVLCGARSRWAFFFGLRRFLGIIERLALLAIAAVFHRVFWDIDAHASVARARVGYSTLHTEEAALWAVGVLEVKEVLARRAELTAGFAAVLIRFIIESPTSHVAAVHVFIAIIAIVAIIYAY